MKRAVLRWLTASAVALTALAAVAIVLRQLDMLDRYFLFFPERDLIATPADFGLEYEDVFLDASDGVRLHGWFVKGESDVTLLWFHGNAGNISHRLNNLTILHESLKASIFIMDYRGYGRSGGSVTEEGTYLDAEAAIAYLQSREDVDSNRIVLFGRSLGAAIAVEMATRHQFYAVILESPFTSIAEMAKQVHPVLSSLLPVGAVIKSKYDSIAKIGRISAPLLILHGDADDTAPIEVGRRLFDAASEPKRFYAIEGAGHNDTYITGGESYFEELRRFIEQP